MRLATLRDGSRDGSLIVASSDGERAASASAIASSLRAALDDWDRCEPALQQLSHDLSRSTAPSFAVELDRLAAPLPRAAEWIDGSAYLSHVRLVRRARKANPPASLESDPLVYQGGSSDLLGSREPFRLIDPSFGLDLEAELGIVLGDTPQGTSASAASQYVRLLVCLNDWTYRNLVPDELAKGFGFFCSKPATSFAPFAVTPDELGGAWGAGRLTGSMRVTLDGAQLGDPETGPEMHFSFFELVAHICRTRRFGAGTILGSGTISNADSARGVSCLQELRARESVERGAPQTPFLKAGNHVGIEFRLHDGRTPFGDLQQRVIDP